MGQSEQPISDSSVVGLRARSVARGRGPQVDAALIRKTSSLLFSNIMSSNRFIASCARWVGEGWHLDLLKDILEYGFDASLIDSPLASNWPLPCDPNWKSEQDTPDPFFVEYLGIIAKHSPGMAAQRLELISPFISH